MQVKDRNTLQYSQITAYYYARDGNAEEPGRSVLMHGYSDGLGIKFI